MHDQPSEERQAIADTIATYLDGFYAGDSDKLASVFHPSCLLTQSLEGELHVITRSQWLAMVRERPSPAKLSLPRVDQVIAVELLAPGLAHVALKCAIVPRYFTDSLSLLKIDGRWQVVQKVYSTASSPRDA